VLYIHELSSSAKAINLSLPPRHSPSNVRPVILRMRPFTAAVLAACLLPLATARCEEKETLDALLARIEKVPDDSNGLGDEEQAYIAKLLEHEQEAIPRLVTLLAHPDENVAELAAATLRDCKHIDPEYLPQIIAGLDRGIGWLPGALGKMDSDEAAKEAVKRYLAADSSPQNQEAYAVRLQGARAIPFLIEAAKADGGKDSQVYYLLGYALGEMDPDERAKAIPALKGMLEDKQTSEALAKGTLAMIGYLGEQGLVLEPDLVALRRSNATLTENIDFALIGLRSPLSGKIYAEMLKKDPDRLILRDLAEVGKPARDAGEEVTKLLGHPDWHTRRAAARALGFIGYDPATPQLIALLGDERDVQMNWIAAQSLGRLNAKSAEDALTAAAAKHWHPTVRKEAEIALSHLKSPAPYESQFHVKNFPLEFFRYDDFEIDTEPPPKIPQAVKEPAESKLYVATSPKRIKKLSYKSEIVSYGAKDEAEQREEKGPDGIIVVNQGNIVEHRKPITQVPDVALRVDGGWLAGSDRGEWGGELVFITDGGKPHPVLSVNIHDLYALGKRYIAICGLAHMTSNDGMVYELTRGADAKWTATPWRSLPGAPQASAKTKSGEIFISTIQGGDILLSEDGTFRMAPEAASGNAPSGQETQGSRRETPDEEQQTTNGH